jgi:DNA-binding transcriptional MerR regulator
MTLRHLLYCKTERRNTLGRLYHTSQFARKASVSVRTLRYYDSVELLSPSHHTASGFRLYSDEDFARLQRILALKFLGFSLQEIKLCLCFGPHTLRTSLAEQKAMMQERRDQLDTVIHALTETEALLQANPHDWQAIVHVTQVIRMQQSNDWRKKYFTEEQLQQMENLSRQSYTEEQRQHLAERGKNWTEQDQQRVGQQWSETIAELQHLVATHQDPLGPAARSLAQRWYDLVYQFTQGDAGISKGLNNYYSQLAEIPPENRPIPLPFNQEEGEFLKTAMQAYTRTLQNQPQSNP